MDILSLIKDKLTDSVIEKVSGFLGEHPEKIGPALNSAVPIVMGGIIRSASTEEGSGKIMDVLKDGGHTGEILDDLPNLLENFDKTQLLITIGSNIFNHFSGNKGNAIVEKLSSLNGIRKTSASSLVGLVAPLVLGALGKVVDKEGLGVSGLTKLLGEQQEIVFGALPPAIANQLNFKSATPPTASATDEPHNEEKKSTPNKLASWIPWVLVSFLFLGVLAYSWQYFKSQKNTIKESVEELPKTDSVYVNDSFSTEIPFDTSNILPSTEATTIKEQKPLEKLAEKEEKVEKPLVIDKKKEEIKVKETPQPIVIENNAPAISFSEQLKNSTSWIALNTNFKKNSGEITSKGELDNIAKYLKSNRKASIIIAGGSQSSGSTLAEDRAYAVREILFEKGVSENQLSVQSSTVKEVTAKVVIKIKR